MAFLQWNDKYSVGVASLDEQHQRWFELINALHDAMLAGRGTDVVSRVYDEMMDYTRTHFGEEERLMKATGYPAYPEHKLAHDNFVREIASRISGTGTFTLKDTLEAMTTLRQWLVTHIQQKDQQYTAHFRAHGVS